MAIKKHKILPSLIEKDIVLTGESAKKFNKLADKAAQNPGTIDFTEQIKICKQILEKSNLKLRKMNLF